MKPKDKEAVRLVAKLELEIRGELLKLERRIRKLEKNDNIR